MSVFAYNPWHNSADWRAVASNDNGWKRAWVSIRIFVK